LALYCGFVLSRVLSEEIEENAAESVNKQENPGKPKEK
jgi:hypothetical protein